MIADNQPLDCLNLSEKYVSHWTYLQGLRELYQNFMDACVEKYPLYRRLRRSDEGNMIYFRQAKRDGANLQQLQQNYISYNKLRKTLIFQNEKSFPVKCLLMGCSQKGPDALGQFGQGMKLSMIVLIKAGLNVTIQSGQNIYYPTLKSWDHHKLYVNKYESNVLYTKVQSKKFEDKTIVKVENVDAQKFQQFLYLSLALLDQSKYKLIVCGKSTLIIPNDTKLVGKVYKKGVRLELHQSKNSVKFQHYSYDFEEISVGRQRDCVNNVWDLYRLQSLLHFNVMQKNFDNAYLKDNPHMRPILRQHVTNIYRFLSLNNFVTYYFHQYSKNNKQLCDMMYLQFLQSNKTCEELYPMQPHAKSNYTKLMILYGLPNSFYPIVDISWQIWHTLIYSNKYQSIDKKIDVEILQKQIRELSQEENKKINEIKLKIAVLLPQIKNYSFKAKSFRDIVSCKDKNNTVIYINPQEIKNEQKMVKSLLKIMLVI